MKKCLILGMASGYDHGQVRPFVTSLERTGFKGDLVLFVSKISGETAAFLRGHGARLVRVEDERAHLEDFSGKLNVQPGDISRDLSPCNMRYILYYSYLSRHGKKYSRVMLADVRDVFFQRDPFDFDSGGGLCCFLEDRCVTIGSEKLNSKWMRTAFGKDMLSKMGGNCIACSGVTIGTVPSMIEYLERMSTYLAKTESEKGIDQAVHNFLVYNDMLPDLRIFENGSGPVLNLDHTRRISFNEDGCVVNGEGDIINVIHQYDRHPGLVSLFGRILSTERGLTRSEIHAHLRHVRLNAFISGPSHYADRLTGLAGAVLKEHSPNLYLRLKRIQLAMHAV